MYVSGAVRAVGAASETFMTTHNYVGAIDQGTAGTRCMVFDHDGTVLAHAHEAHDRYTPGLGLVEHDASGIWENTKTAMTAALASAGIEAEDLAAIGIANQRETTVLWDAATGEPVHDAIGWQDRRTTDRIEGLEAAGRDEEIRRITGLQPDAYFSATKVEWLLENAEPDDHDGRALRERAADGDVLMGTIDSWLVYNLTGAHVTDVTNASRTMLFDIDEMAWSDELLDEFDVPAAMLPEVRPSSDEAAYGYTDTAGFLGASVPVTAALGDQQAALFGQTCFDSGEAKNTYGTGSFFLLNTGGERVVSDNGLLTTVAFQRSGEPVQYALEGAIFVTGTALEWLEEVSIVDNPAEIATLARSVDSTDGVYVVPAFSGLGAPHWDGRARGTILGVTRETRKEHVVRATLESIAYRTRDVAEAMAADTGFDVTELRVDGGAVRNNFLCQLQADVLQADVVRPTVDETTALGAAYAAGLAVGYWESLAELRDNYHVDRVFSPERDAAAADRDYERWTEAVERSLGWARNG